jgi:hypothetical protein
MAPLHQTGAGPETSPNHGWVGNVLRYETTEISQSIELIGNRAPHLPACSIVPQPTTLPRAPVEGNR